MLDEIAAKETEIQFFHTLDLFSSVQLKGMPIASIKSALPHFELIDLLPCLITGIPALANINETNVEILKLFALSPPVPHRSIALSAKSPRLGSIDNLRNSFTK